MIRRFAFLLVLALTGAALVIGPDLSRGLTWADVTLSLFAATGAGIAGLLLTRLWQRSLAWLVLAAVLTTGLGGLIGGVITMTGMALRPPSPFGTYWLPPVQMLGMSVAVPFMLMAETIWKIPLWLAGMALAAGIIRGSKPAEAA
jgi:hypothetical protein